MKDRYESPLASRYASDDMLHLFSPDMRFETWRRLWVSLAKVQHALGLPVTSHIYAFGAAAPGAKGIIHLGATSCYVTDNADLVLYRDALVYLRGELEQVMVQLAGFADRYAALPCLGYTHYQPAQLVTVGKRATLWLQDLMKS